MTKKPEIQSLQSVPSGLDQDVNLVFSNLRNGQAQHAASVARFRFLPVRRILFVEIALHIARVIIEPHPAIQLDSVRPCRFDGQVEHVNLLQHTPIGLGGGREYAMHLGECTVVFVREG